MNTNKLDGTRTQHPNLTQMNISTEPGPSKVLHAFDVLIKSLVVKLSGSRSTLYTCPLPSHNFSFVPGAPTEYSCYLVFLLPFGVGFACPSFLC